MDINNKLLKDLFNESFTEINMEIGGERVLVRRATEFPSYSENYGRGDIEGFNHDSIDNFLREKGYEYYLVTGHYSVFISHVDVDFGYKFFTINRQQTPAPYETVERIFSIHKDLSDNNFGPEPYEILSLDKNIHFIRIQKPVGIIEVPDEEWTGKILEYCRQRKIYRDSTGTAQLPDEVRKKSNVIKTPDGYYFIDVDYKMLYGKEKA